MLTKHSRKRVRPVSLYRGNPLTFSQLGGVSKPKSRRGSAALVRNVYAQSGADGRESARSKLNSVTPISCDKFFRFNVYIFLPSLKPENCLASRRSRTWTEIYNPLNGSTRQGKFERAFGNGCPRTGTDMLANFLSTSTGLKASRCRSHYWPTRRSNFGVKLGCRISLET